MNPVLFVLLSVLLYSGLPRPVEGRSAAEREQILGKLLRNANRLVRPDGESGEGSAVVVSLGLSLIRILEVDEVKGWLKLLAYLPITWKDPRMTFDRDNMNTSTIPVEASSIWTPDIELYQPDSEGLKVVTRKDLVVVSRTGDMTYVPAVVMASFCDQNPGYFHSAMNCTLSLGSWVHSGLDVDIQLASPAPDTSDYVPSGRWTLGSAAATRHVKYYSCCPEPYITIDFSFQVVWQ